VQLESALETITVKQARENQDWIQERNQLNKTITEMESKLKYANEELSRMSKIPEYSKKQPYLP